MKKLFLLFILTITIRSYAQIKFSKEDLSGTTPTATISVLGNIDLPSFGENKTWDYSTLEQADTSVQQFRLASASRYYSKFPEAALILIAPEMEEESEPSLSLYKIGDNGLYKYGTYNPSEDSLYKNDRATLYLPAPITYNQTVIDSSREVNDYIGDEAGVHYASFTKVHYTAVGYGNIHTPAGKFENTLLIKKVEYLYDSTNYEDTSIPAIVYLDTIIEYTWIQKDKSLPVVFRMELNKEETEVLMASYSSTDVILAVSGEEKIISKQFPNPANEELNIEFAKAQEGILTLYSLDGQVKLKENLNNTNKATLTTQKLEPGIYFYDVTTSYGSSARNKLVVTH